MNGVEEMSTNEKENTESVNKETDNDIRQQPIFQQYESGVRLALMLFEFDIAHPNLISADMADFYKRVADAIAKARNASVPMARLKSVIPPRTFDFPSRDPYEINVTVCNYLVHIAIDMVRFELAENSTDVNTLNADIKQWDQFWAIRQSDIVVCLNSMLFGYNYNRVLHRDANLIELVRALCPNPDRADTLIRMAEGQYIPQQAFQYAQFTQGTPLWTYPSPLQTTTTDKQ